MDDEHPTVVTREDHQLQRCSCAARSEDELAMTWVPFDVMDKSGVGQGVCDVVIRNAVPWGAGADEDAVT